MNVSDSLSNLESNLEIYKFCQECFKKMQTVWLRYNRNDKRATAVYIIRPEISLIIIKYHKTKK